MALWKPDPTFYPSPRMAMQAPPEKLAYVAVVNPRKNGRPDALGVPGDELHHFGALVLTGLLTVVI